MRAVFTVFALSLGALPAFANQCDDQVLLQWSEEVARVAGPQLVKCEQGKYYVIKPIGQLRGDVDDPENGTKVVATKNHFYNKSDGDMELEQRVPVDDFLSSANFNNGLINTTGGGFIPISFQQ